MKSAPVLVLASCFALALTGCGESRSDDHGHTHRPGDSAAGTHTHPDGATHADHPDGMHEDDHDHDEVDLGTIMIGDMEVKLAQSHGAVAAGKEGHLVVKLPYNDNGATIVRAWLGTEDRTLSYVGRGEYAAAHDDYDIHAMAPDPLPEPTLWWIEIEKPDGSKFVGSVKPIME